MNQKKKRRTVALIVVGALLIASLIVGSSYAYWKITKAQTDTNEFTTTCLNLDLSNISSGIQMQSQYPISDEDGKATAGYTFKVTNTCNSYVAYDINLESLSKVASSERLNPNFLDTVLNDGNIMDLGSYPETESVLTQGDAYEARTLTTEILGPSTSANASKEYTLRIWLDQDATNDAMNKSWSGKISISAVNTPAKKATERIIQLAQTNTTDLFTDSTTDANIRYMGVDPDNYVYLGDGYYTEDVYHGFNSNGTQLYPAIYPSLAACQAGKNGEYNANCTKVHSKGDPILWRIVGVMNNVDDGTGKKESRLKVAREDMLIATSFSEPCEIGALNEGGGCSSTSYNNIWETSIAHKLLNDTFYNSKVSDAFVGEYNIGGNKQAEKRIADFSSIGLSSYTKQMIGDAKFYLGGPYKGSGSTNQFIVWTANDYYAGARDASQVRSGSPATWTGKIGLLSVSDLGFATVGGSTKNRETCVTGPMRDWQSKDDCTQNNWLTHNDLSKYDQWLMTQFPDDSMSIMSMREAGNLWGDWTHNGYGLRPTAYLKADVKVIDGNGTKANPYKLGI